MITGELSFIAYDTVCRVQASADDEVSVEKALQEIRQSALEVESTLSMYDKNSELSRMNCSYVVDVPYPISSLLLASLPYNLTIAKMTEGAFDPTIGPLVRLWDFLNDEPKVPDYSTIEQVLKRVGYQHIHLDQKRKTITFSQSNMILDPGASGKGFALGLALDLLRKNKISHGVIDYGGNLYVHGGKIQTGAPLITAIRDPQETNSILGTVPLVDKAIATSSWYEHYFTIEGKVYHHILDPRTGYPHNLELQSVSIISSAPLFTDLVSTAFFLVGFEKGESLIRLLKRTYEVDLEYVAVLSDGTLKVSSGAGFKPFKQDTGTMN